MPDTGIPFHVEGNGTHLAALAKELERLGEGELRKELDKRMRASAKVVTKLVRASALAKLPKAGGLNVRVAKSSIRVSSKVSHGQVAVRLTVKGAPRTDVASIDERGIVRHPTFGLPETWVSQHVPPDTLTGPMKESGPVVQRAIDEVADDIEARLYRKT